MHLKKKKLCLKLTLIDILIFFFTIYIQRGCYDDDGMVVEHVSFYIICNLCLLQLKMVSKHVIPIIDKGSSNNKIDHHEIN
jgi:hypothetical protein